MRLLILLLLTGSSFILTCKVQHKTAVDFLAGTWKVKNKEQFEVWEKKSPDILQGYAYKWRDNKKIITETLSIKKLDNQLVYEATVPDQNEGKTIPFKLNREVKDCLSFENLLHDFPKKIQYKKISDKEILVRVLGENDPGFSYTIFKE